MTFLDRLATLFKADAHGVVDALEDKALLVRQHVREAGAELARKRCRLEAFDVEEKDLEAEIVTIDKGKGELEEDIELAMSSDKEELARFAVKKLLPLRRRATSIEQRLEALRRERADLAEEVKRQDSEYQELQLRARGYLARLERPEGLDASGDAGWWEAVADEDVELELLRRRHGATSPEGGS